MTTFLLIFSLCFRSASFLSCSHRSWYLFSRRSKTGVEGLGVDTEKGQLTVYIHLDSCDVTIYTAFVMSLYSVWPQPCAHLLGQCITLWRCQRPCLVETGVHFVKKFSRTHPCA